MIVDLSRKVLNWQGEEATEAHQVGVNEVDQPIYENRPLDLKLLLVRLITTTTVSKSDSIRAFVIAAKLAESNGSVELSTHELNLLVDAVASSDIVSWVKASIFYLLRPDHLGASYREVFDKIYGKGQPDAKV